MNHQYMNVSDGRTNASQQFAGDAFHLGSTHPSPTSFDQLVDTATWHQHIPPPSAAAASGSSNTSSVATKTTLPIQKRRRVTRACDECRRKKIKCDGKQPCTHCTVYSYECTYDQPSNRRRNPPPQYIEALENRLQRAEALLKTFVPNLDLSRPELGPATTRATASVYAAKTPSDASITGSEGTKTEKESLLDSMVELTGRLDIDETGHVDFHGHSSGLTYISQLGILGDVKMGSSSWPVAKVQQGIPQLSSQSPQSDNIPDVTLLPPRNTAIFLVEICLGKACVLMRFIHRPSFMSMASRLYDLRVEDYDDEENSFLPLFYMALGVGCLFVDEGDIAVENTACEAMKYFNAGRRMIEMTDIRDIYSLQAVLLMTIYLQSSTRMSTCYSYVGIALSAAVRMGLHREIPTTRFNCIEKEVRKRIFWTCWKMDTYVGAILGLPKGIAPEDIDVEMPIEVDDENITKELINPQAEGTVSTMAAANAHTKLLAIMAKTVKYIYPIKGVEASVSGHEGGYSVSQTKLREIEMDLQEWLESLPSVLKPGLEDTPREFLKCQYLLAMSHLHVQMMLYRPFVHYISHQKNKDCDDISYAIGSACVNVARKIVHTTEEMRKLRLLNGAYWFTIYTTFFSIITLVYYVMVNPPDSTCLSVLADAKIGRECLSSIQGKSLAAKRCTVALTPPFEQIEEKYNSITLPTGPKKKRPRAASQTQTGEEGNQPSSPTSQTSPGTISPTQSADESPAHRPKASPASSIDISRSLSPPPHLFGGKFAPASDSVNQKSPYELSQNADFGTPQPETPSQQPQQQPRPSFEANIANTGLPDLGMIFSSSDMFGFPLTTMDPMVQRFKPGPTTGQINPPIYQTIPCSHPFENLEGNILGPVPPYLLQSQQQVIDDNRLGQGEQAQRQRIGGSGTNELSGQYFAANGGDSMVQDFFKDEWADEIMQTFRQT